MLLIYLSINHKYNTKYITNDFNMIITSIKKLKDCKLSSNIKNQH